MSEAEDYPLLRKLWSQRNLEDISQESTAATEPPPDQFDTVSSDRIENMDAQDENDNIDQRGGTVECALCKYVPTKTPLLGCHKGHYMCCRCREKGGVLLSCPRCLAPDISHRLIELERQLFTEECNFSKMGCSEMITEDNRAVHENDCKYRIVQCPKRLYAKSCTFYDSFINVRKHGREEHGYNKGFTVLDKGCITSKMLDNKEKGALNIMTESARFPPLELEFDEDLFYIYYERKHSRSIWLFFMRFYGSEEQASKYTCEIHLGPGNLDKNDIFDAERIYRGKVVPYSLNREEIHSSGRCLVVDDASISGFRHENTLFRIWWRVMLKKS